MNDDTDNGKVSEFDPDYDYHQDSDAEGKLINKETNVSRETVEKYVDMEVEAESVEEELPPNDYHVGSIKIALTAYLERNVKGFVETRVLSTPSLGIASEKEALIVALGKLIAELGDKVDYK